MSAQDTKQGRARVSQFGFARFVAEENANNRAAAFTPDMYRVEFSTTKHAPDSSQWECHSPASAHKHSMCIEYELRTESFQAALPFLRQEMPFIWAGPEPDRSQFRVGVGSRGAVVRLDGDRLVGELMSWGWEEGRQTIFNLRSEGRDFSQDQRVLILATGHYEYTEPMEPMILGHEQHFFAMKGERWLFIAGIAMGDCFSLLTTKAGLDIRPYCKRQPCVLSLSAGLDWLRGPRPEMLKPSEAGTMSVRTLYGAETFAIPNGLRGDVLHERMRQKSRSPAEG
jgi:putative SOS response-associated peptidase YedK